MIAQIRMGLIGLGFLCLTVLVLLTFTLVTPNTGKDIRHVEAPNIRNQFRDGVCEGEEIYYSFSMGTLLILCGLPNSDQWGGIVWRVTENSGQLGLEEPYEVTVFAGTRQYWTGVINRDGYTPIAMAPSLKRLIRGSY